MDEENKIAGENVDTATTTSEEDTSTTTTLETNNENENVDTTTGDENAPVDAANENVPQTFTQEQVNDFVRERLAKQESRLFRRYGVQSKDELDELVSKSQSYDIMRERYDELTNENNSLKIKIAFKENNMNDALSDDIMAYFSGKNLEFNNENLKTELANHPEWVNKPKVSVNYIGAEQTNKPKQSDEDIAKKWFGLKGFVK